MLMKNYEYDPLIPEAVDALISEVVEHWGAERNLHYEPWYHGLPIWIVSGREGDRTTKVQIEVINAGSITRLSFTPDAFEDIVFDDKEGHRVVERKVAAPDSLLTGRVELPLDSLAERGALDFSIKTGARGKIEAALESAWAAAGDLEMTREPQRIQYVIGS